MTVALWTLPAEGGSQTEIVARGRYLDRWSRRGGNWALDHREHVLDLVSNRTLDAGEVSDSATRDLRDPSFAYIAKR